MPATSWSGFWGDGTLSNGNYSLLSNKNPIRYRAKRLANRASYRQLTPLFNALIGAASGSNVTATHKQVAAHNTETSGFGIYGGGPRTIETVTDINRNTTAADITALKEIVFGVTTRPSTYPRDLSGNGGPAYT